MSKLIQELQRLYCLPDQKVPAGDGAVGLNLLAVDGRVRAMVLGFERAADWPWVGNLYQALQDDLELPPPAISVSGLAGYQFWFSLADPVPLAQAEAFLDALRLKYLADMPLARLKFYPSTDCAMVNLVPALCEATQKWSAFIDPTMGAMFVEESGLEMAPGRDRQAEMLSGLKSITVGDFERVLGVLLAEFPAGTASSSEATFRSAEPGSDKYYSDPQSFLLAVMNDPSAGLEHRIEAAKALLPAFSRSRVAE